MAVEHAEEGLLAGCELWHHNHHVLVALVAARLFAHTRRTSDATDHRAIHLHSTASVLDKHIDGKPRIV